MKDAIETLAACAREVAEAADATVDPPAGMEHLLTAMMHYRSAAMMLLAHPSVGAPINVSALIKAHALKYKGETRQALESIAQLVDSLNQR